MRGRVLRIYVLLTLPATSFYAQGIAGDWQGVLKVGPEQTRHILHIVKNEGGPLGCEAL